MKKVIISLILLLSIHMAFGQTAKLLIMKPIMTKSGLSIRYRINNGDTAKVFYKITKIAFCEGLAALKIIDIKSKVEKLYFPCKGLIDLKTIAFTDKNSFLLNSNGLYKSTLLIRFNDISPALIKRHRYKIQLFFNYNNIPTEAKIQYCNNQLVSNELCFIY